MTQLEPLPRGAVVTYHGSLQAEHGTWTVAGPCACGGCMTVFHHVWDQIYWSLPLHERPNIDKHYEPYNRYELEREDGDRLLCVRRSSITPATQDSRS
ncbi:hypothetical protein [Nonomuraea sp. NPDC023979]|uniref:hypothetical protein n=1 Tax=Nonomuraea sp. NPDC023979 TaxID=3154796 RepID=UPI0033D11A50